MKSIEWIDQLKIAKGLSSDNQAALMIGISRGGISQHRSGACVTLKDEQAFKLEELLGLPHGEIVLDQHAEREKNPNISAMWRNLGKIASNGGMVPGDGIEPPTRGFSILCSTD